MNDKGYDFWKRIDAMRKTSSLSSICNATGIKYSRVKENRSDNRIPCVEDLYLLSNYLGCSIEYLLTGEARDVCPEADFVIKNKAARLLIRRIMENPSLLEALAAVAALAVPPGETKEKNA